MTPKREPWWTEREEDPRPEIPDGKGTWRPSFPPGRYLGRTEAAAMMWAAIDLMAHGPESLWHGVESWDQAQREGIVAWYEQARRERHGGTTDDRVAGRLWQPPPALPHLRLANPRPVADVDAPVV